MNPVAADQDKGGQGAGLATAATDGQTGEVHNRLAGEPGGLVVVATDGQTGEVHDRFAGELGAGLVVAATDEQTGERSEPVDVGVWAALAEGALRAEGVTVGECNLVFVDPDEMARLNAEHMGQEGPTDVLSFPLDGADPDPVGTRLVGDVVVCPAYAARPADPAAARLGAPANTRDATLDSGLDTIPDAARPGDSDGTNPADGLALLVVHGVLHLLGYDHAEAADAARMRARERELLAACYRRS